MHGPSHYTVIEAWGGEGNHPVHSTVAVLVDVVCFQTAMSPRQSFTMDDKL